MQKLKNFRLPKNFRGRHVFFVQLWWIVQSVFFNTSPQFMFFWRRFLLRLFGAKIGRGVMIRPSVQITYPWKLVIGDYAWIGDNVVLYTLGKISIGENVVISQRSYLCTGSHDYLKEDFPIFEKEITIEDECWLATDVYVAPGINIGRATVVGARSSVFNDLPSSKICIGSPAKVLRDRLS